MPRTVASLDVQRAICYRDLTRLRRLEMRYRFRALVSRGFRGFIGFVLGLAATIKLKIAATLGGKILIAVLIGLGFAWPAAAITVILIGLVILSIAALCEGGPAGCTAADCCMCDGCDFCDGNCKAKNMRRERLLKMIAEREEWLAKGEGPPPYRHRAPIPHVEVMVKRPDSPYNRGFPLEPRRDDPNS